MAVLAMTLCRAFVWRQRGAAVYICFFPIEIRIEYRGRERKRTSIHKAPSTCGGGGWWVMVDGGLRTMYGEGTKVTVYVPESHNCECQPCCPSVFCRGIRRNQRNQKKMQVRARVRQTRFLVGCVEKRQVGCRLFTGPNWM